MSSKKYRLERLRRIRSFRVDADVTSVAILKYLEALDCPRALTVALLYRNMEHEQLANLSCDPLDYLGSQEFSGAYLATKFLSKYKDLTLDYDLDKVAMEKFEKFESLCKHTNSRFRNLSVDPLYKGSTVWLHHATARKIDKLLGAFYPEEFFDLANWGPGASFLIKARDACSANKFQCETGITRDLYSLLPLSLLKGVYPLWASQLAERGFPTFCVGNKVVTVPKDATTNRVIAIEPGINLWFQKAIGEMIGTRLRRVGIDLRFQNQNQRLAFVGSKSRRLATIDLSSASDSISTGVVRDLIPHEWFHVLDTCRSRFGFLGDRTVEWAKFSSMGNGFTFQLESLIFYAAASSCVDYLKLDHHDCDGPTVSVYGDDIVIPVECLDLFSSLLEFYGFKLNMKKTHFASQFRESCGSHYFDGVDVKPVYLKSKLIKLPSVFRLANAFRRLSHRQCNFTACDSRFKKVFDFLVNQVTRDLRFRIPETLGDGGFIGNFDESAPVRALHYIEGYFVWHVVETSLPRQFDGVGLLLARLRDPSAKEERNNVTLRGRTELRITRSLVNQWRDFGPWV